MEQGGYGRPWGTGAYLAHWAIGLISVLIAVVLGYAMDALAAWRFTAAIAVVAWFLLEGVVFALVPTLRQAQYVRRRERH